MARLAAVLLLAFALAACGGATNAGVDPGGAGGGEEGPGGTGGDEGPGGSGGLGGSGGIGGSGGVGGTGGMGGTGGSGEEELFLSCTPGRVDFFETYVDEAVTRLVVCENLSVPGPDGRATISLDRLEVEGSGFSAAWRGSPPAALAPGEAAFIEVRFAPSATGAFVGRLVVGGDDAFAEVPLTGMGSRRPACDVEIVPEEIRFGTVETGRTMTLEFALQNRASTPCEIERVAACEGNAPGFTLVGGPYEHIVLAAGEERRFPVSIEPSWVECIDGPEACVAFVLGDDREELSLDCPAPAQLPMALLAPDRLDFGKVAIGTEVRRSFQVIDIVSVPIVIAAIEFAEGSSPEFAIADGPSVGQVIAPGGSATVTVSYRPDGSGGDASAIFVFLEGEAEPYMVTLGGAGIAP